MKVRSLRDQQLRDRAREMRCDSTTAEAHLWKALRAHRLGGWKWRRQAPKGPYIVDFLCDGGALVVEVDGEVHLEQVDYDTRRTVYLGKCGLRVVRFWNWQVLQSLDDVCLTILASLGGGRAAGDVEGRGSSNPRRAAPKAPLS